MGRFKGFTLSELMIALAVIGVLIAVVTPAIVNTRPNKNKMMVKKSFYTVEQVVSSLINDEHLYPDKREQCEDPTDLTNCAWGFDNVDEATFEGAEYKNNYKFAGLFKEKLNVASNDASFVVAGAGPDDSDFYPVFYTTDGIKWDFTGTNEAWTSGQQKVGTFDNQTDAAGIGRIMIDVNGNDEPNCRENSKADLAGSVDCTGSEDDFDRYVIEILASGKLRIHPDDTRAIDWATINTSIRDTL